MEREQRINRESYQDLGSIVKMVTLTDTSLTYTMKVSDRILFVDTTSVTGDGNAIVYLPSVAEAVGKFYYIEAPKAATGGDLSLYAKETGAELATYGDLDADADHILFFSTGQAWKAVLNGIA